MHPRFSLPMRKTQAMLLMLVPIVDSRPSLTRAMVNNRGLGCSATDAEHCRTSELGYDRGGRTREDSVAGEQNRIPHLALIQSYRPLLATLRRQSVCSLCRDALVDLEGDFFNASCRVRGSHEVSKRSREYRLRPAR